MGFKSKVWGVVEITPGSAWAEARFGKLSSQLPAILREAMNTAHEIALKAHLSGEMDRQDTYGHTLKVKMHEVLADALDDVPGITMKKPAGGSFRLPVIQETAVALLPIRYSTDRREPREGAKINLSNLRRSLFALGANSATKPQQLNIEDALIDDADIDSHYREMAEIDEQLASFGCVVTIGFGSNPNSGLWGLGWGDLSLSETSDKTMWKAWEPFPEASPNANQIALAPEIRSTIDSQPVYFDQTDESDELILSPRDPHTGSEGESPSIQATGNSTPS